MSEPTVFVRYGVISEVVRFSRPLVRVERGQRVVVKTRRGLELGTVLEQVGSKTNGHHENGHESHDEIVRSATAGDEETFAQLRSDAQQEYSVWSNRIREWKLDLELIDLEWTLDREKLILYVLGGRGPDCTKLSLNAAAAGITGVEVQPLNAEGLVAPEMPARGGCGSGGCGCHH